MIMLAVVAVGGYLVLKSGLLSNLGGGGDGGDGGDAAAAAPAAPAEPAAPAAPADPYAGMQQPQGQYPIGVPYGIPYPVPYGYNVPLDQIYLQDNLVGGYCHLRGRQICWIGPTGLVSCFNLSQNDFGRWPQDPNLRVRVCRSIRGRYISAHPFRRLPKSKHTPPHRTNNDNHCGFGNHWDPRLRRCIDNGGNHPPGDSHHCPENTHWDTRSNHCVPDLSHGGPGGGGPAGDHGGPPGGGPHNCPLHQHWDDHLNKCTEDSTPPPGGGTPHPGGPPHPTPLPAASNFAISI